MGEAGVCMCVCVRGECFLQQEEMIESNKTEHQKTWKKQTNHEHVISNHGVKYQKEIAKVSISMERGIWKCEAEEQGKQFSGYKTYRPTVL